MCRKNTLSYDVRRGTSAQRSNTPPAGGFSAGMSAVPSSGSVLPETAVGNWNSPFEHVANELPETLAGSNHAGKVSR